MADWCELMADWCELMADLCELMADWCELLAIQGGKKILLKNAGKDASEDFEMLHPPNTLKKYAKEVRLFFIYLVFTKVQSPA
jgi:hypothetical protein